MAAHVRPAPGARNLDAPPAVRPMHEMHDLHGVHSTVHMHDMHDLHEMHDLHCGVGSAA